MGVLRVATFNLLHGMSLLDGSTDEKALAEAAASIDADVVGVQEVDHLQERSGHVDQTATVAHALGACAWRFVPALHGTPNPEGRWLTATGHGSEPPDGPAYGIGLVSRLPVLTWDVRRFRPAPVGAPLLVPGKGRLMHMPDEPRVAVAAVVSGPNHPFTVVTTHLSFVPGFNLAQLRQLARWARAFPAPRILLGDLNVPGRLPARVTGWRQLARIATYPSYKPRVQFDHVLGQSLDGMKVRGARALRLGVSDHCALRVDLTLPGRG